MLEATRRGISAGVTHPVTLAMVVAFGLGAVIIAVTGGAPLAAFSDMFTGAFTGRGLPNTLGRAIPVIGMALAVSLAFRAGILNLGGEGQMLMGGLAGTMTAITVPGPGYLVVPLALVVGGLAGAGWALLAALGQTHLQVPLLITSLLLNYVARSTTSYLVRFPFGAPGAPFATTVPVPETARIPRIDLFPGGRVSISLLFVLGFAGLLAVVYRRSVFGYETEMVGLSGPFSRYGGVHVERHTLAIMAGAGAIGGLVGTHLVVGETFRYIDADMIAQSGFAWTGLMVSLLALNRPLLIVAAGLLFAGLQIGGFAMERASGVSWQLAQVIQAVVIVALVSRFAITRGRRRSEAETEAVPEPDAEATQVGKV